MPVPQIAPGILQRKCDCGQHTIAGGQCSGCSEKREENLQRSEGRWVSTQSDAGAVSPIVHDVLRSSGQPLGASTRTLFESHFRHDFSRVRVHTDARAAESAQSVNALAYTVGHDVVFGAGQYAPSTYSGQKLLAHELTHTIQQASNSGLMTSALEVGDPNDRLEQEAEQVAAAFERSEAVAPQSHESMVVGQLLRTAAAPIIRRRNQGAPSPSLNSAECPDYEANELQASYSEAGHLAPDVIRIAPDKLLVADFGVNSRNVKNAAATDPTLQSWFNTFETDDSYHLSIVGYSDCITADNIALRQGRAQRVEALLGSKARSRVTFRGMAALGDYVTTNATVEGRAKNRGVVVQFQQDFTIDEPEEITVTPRRCGPDSTQWLLDQMDTNRNHPVIKTSREVQWPNYIPFFNIGWNAGVLLDFRSLVRAGGPWDFKSNQSQWRSHAGRDCPTRDCDRTVTLCGRCFNYDVPGNIHYGWIGRQAGLRAWFLHNRADAAQAGGLDDPKDVVAIDVGVAMADDGASLCDELRLHGNELNLTGSAECNACTIT